MLRVVGPHALIDPVVTARADLITLTDREVPVLGRVLQLGRGACPDCGATLQSDVEVGALVLVPPAVGQEITVDDHIYWMVPMADLLAEWKEPL